MSDGRDLYSEALESVESVASSILKGELTSGVARMSRSLTMVMTPEQHENLLILGGANWIRSMLSFTNLPTYSQLATIRPDLPDVIRGQYSSTPRVATSQNSFTDAFDPIKSTSISSSKLTLNVFRQLPQKAPPLCIGVLREILRNNSLSTYARSNAVLLSPTMAETNTYNEPKTWEIVQPYLYTGHGRYLRLATVAWLLSYYKDQEDLFVVDDDLLKMFSFTFPADADFSHVDFGADSTYSLSLQRDTWMNYAVKSLSSETGESFEDFSKFSVSEFNKFNERVTDRFELLVRESLDFKRRAVRDQSDIEQQNTQDVISWIKSRSSLSYVEPFDTRLNGELFSVYRTLLSRSEEDHYRYTLGIKGVYYIKASVARPWAVKLTTSEKDNKKEATRGMTYLGSFRNYVDATMAAIEARLFKAVHDGRTDAEKMSEWAWQFNTNQELIRLALREQKSEIIYKLGITPEKRLADVIMADYLAKLANKGV